MPSQESTLKQLQDAYILCNRAGLPEAAAVIQHHIKSNLSSILPPLIKLRRANQKSDVHTRHCCATCGCKYGEEDCPVVTRAKVSEHDCTSNCLG